MVEAATHRAERRRARRRRWRWRVGIAAILAVMTAAAVWFVTSVQEAGVATARVANYVGDPIEDVRSRADDAGWVLGEREVRDDDTPLGTVVGQVPAAGAELEVGSTVTVDVVQGRFLVLVPRLVGLDVGAATERATARGFEVAEQVRQYNETVPAGVVMEALVDGAVEPGMSLRESGTSIAMVISDGPTPRVVPKVEGLTVAAATEALGAEQLRLQVEAEEFSDTVEAGLVIRQAVPPDARVDRDSVVLVVVSKGPDLRVVPDLRGMTLDQATAQLAAVGLRRGPVEGSGPVVQFTEPVAGTSHPPGTEITLFAPAPAQ
jgi:serine/threonine-protein kinase